jgi:hypothetical protein
MRPSYFGRAAVILWCAIAWAQSAVYAAADHVDSDPLLRIDSVEALISANPQALAHEVLRSNRIRFLGVADFALHVPGIEDDQCGVDPTYVYVVPGTGDVLTERRAALQEQAKAIAEEYNHVLREHFIRSETFRSMLVCTPVPSESPK